MKYRIKLKDNSTNELEATRKSLLPVDEKGNLIEEDVKSILENIETEVTTRYTEGGKVVVKGIPSNYVRYTGLAEDGSDHKPLRIWEAFDHVTKSFIESIDFNRAKSNRDDLGNPTYTEDEMKLIEDFKFKNGGDKFEHVERFHNYMYDFFGPKKLVNNKNRYSYPYLATMMYPEGKPEDNIIIKPNLDLPYNNVDKAASISLDDPIPGKDGSTMSILDRVASQDQNPHDAMMSESEEGESLDGEGESLDGEGGFFDVIIFNEDPNALDRFRKIGNDLMSFLTTNKTAQEEKAKELKINAIKASRNNSDDAKDLLEKAATVKKLSEKINSDLEIIRLLNTALALEDKKEISNKLKTIDGGDIGKINELMGSVVGEDGQLLIDIDKDKKSVRSYLSDSMPTNSIKTILNDSQEKLNESVQSNLLERGLEIIKQESGSHKEEEEVEMQDEDIEVNVSLEDETTQAFLTDNKDLFAKVKEVTGVEPYGARDAKDLREHEYVIFDKDNRDLAIVNVITREVTNLTIEEPNTEFNSIEGALAEAQKIESEFNGEAESGYVPLTDGKVLAIYYKDVEGNHALNLHEADENGLSFQTMEKFLGLFQDMNAYWNGSEPIMAEKVLSFNR